MNLTGSTMRMAWRNLWRNPRRTVLALAAIGLSVTLVLAYTSILRAYGQWIVETITGPMLGHVQAHAPQWRKDRLMERTLRNVDATLAEIRRDPDVASATARVYAPALAARGEEGFAVVIMGIDSRAESGPARLLTEVIEPLREREALIGRQLAELMNVRVGDEVAVVGQGVDGSLANDLFRVKAVVTTSVDLVNRQGLLIELSDAQTLFAMPDEAHEIVLHARRPDMASALSRRLAGAGGFAGAEVLDWQTLAPENGDARAHHRPRRPPRAPAGLHCCRGRCCEHHRDGDLRTDARVRDAARPGYAPEPPRQAVITESIALGVVGALTGSLIGIVLVAITHRTGIDYSWLAGGGPSELSFAGLRFSLRFYPALSAVDVARAIGAVCLTSLLAATWPVLRASRLQPVQALRGT
jgi:ABC-type lipoprotein release transport system permease subunit